MERVTLAYKLGRKMQEEHNMHRSGRDADELTPEMFDRIFASYQRSDEKLCKALAKSEELRAENARLKSRIERMKAEKSRPTGGLRKAIGRLLGGDKPSGGKSPHKS